MNKVSSLLGVPVALALAIGATAPASAQYMPHLDPSLYANVIMQMNMGNNTCGPMPESEINEAREPAPALMQSYFDAAQSGSPIAPLFKINGKTRWSHGEASYGRDELGMVSDPLAAPGNSLDTNTMRFFRAGTHGSAQGQWLVLAQDGSVAGVYNGYFERVSGEWMLHKLEVFVGDEMVAPIMHYCTEPGDMDERRVNGLTAQIERLERRLESRTEKYDRAMAQLTEAEARAAEKPDSSGRARRVVQRREKVEERRAKMEETSSDLREARLDLTEARAELAQLRSHTTYARHAASFRELDDEGKRITDTSAKAEEQREQLEAKE